MSIMSLYEQLPDWIQNIAVSLYGLARERRRYGGDFNEKLNSICKQEYEDKAYIDSYQNNQLKLLFECAQKSSYYDEVFKEQRIDKYSDPMTFLHGLPLLTKQELRGHEEKFITEKKKGDQIFHTSGSTGTPLSVRMGIDDFRMRMAILERMKQRFGISHTSKHVSFVGKKITSRKSKTFWRINKFGNQMVMSVYNLSDENKDRYLNAIKNYKPEMIEGYPSALYVLAKWFIEKGEDLQLKCVIVTAETLSDEQQRIIAMAFHCPVINYYGSTEGATMITPCEYGNLHVEYESGIIEFLDDNDENVNEGLPARMVVTSFLTKAMPLIRYDIGDMAIVGNRRCPCGRHTQTVKAIIGRCDDVFRTTEKGYVGRLSTTLKLLPSFVRRAQIQQIEIDKFIVLLECDKTLSFQQMDVIKNDMIDKLGNVSISFEYTDKIPNGANGKFRSQISMIG